jgi:hypothetical protein
VFRQILIVAFQMEQHQSTPSFLRGASAIF